MGLLFPAEARANVLTALGGPGGSNLWVHLVVNNPPADDALTLAALTLADFPGYAPYNSALWSPPAADTNGDQFIQSPAITFTRGSGAPARTVYAYAVTLGPLPGGLLLAVEFLPLPIPMVAPADVVPLLPIRLADRALSV